MSENNAPYNVVFEYIKGTDAYGVRTWTGYSSEAEYLSTAGSRPIHETPIALGVTDNEAINLCSQTPDICRLVHAVKEAFSDGKEPNAFLLEYRLGMASRAIDHDRIFCLLNGIYDRPNASEYIETFTSEAVTNSLAHQIIRAFLKICWNNTGLVRMADLQATVNMAMVSLITHRMP